MRSASAVSDLSAFWKCVSRSYENKEIPVIELIVLYKMPNDPKHFEKYYREVHGPMTSKLPGLKGYPDFPKLSTLTNDKGENVLTKHLGEGSQYLSELP